MRFALPLILLISSCTTLNPIRRAVLEGEPLEIIASADTLNCEHLELGPINYDSAEKLADEIGRCKGQPVTIEINSPGGQVFAGIAIQKTIERHDAPVVCVVDGMAASAAFVALQACDYRVMTPRSILMAHQAATQAGGQSEDLGNARDVLAAIDRSMALFCSKRMGIAVEDFERRIAGGREWWFSLTDALHFGAVDREVDSVKEAAAISHVIQKR